MTRAASNPGSTPPWLTVAICTWNRCDILRQTLEQIARIRRPEPGTWELIVINNNSTDQTEATIRQFESRLPIRQVIETRRGVANARNRAGSEARGEYIVFADDDVQVCEDWLTSYMAAFRANPGYALFGGPIEPWFPNEPPRWLKRAMGELGAVFGLCDHGDKPVELAPGKTPFGANYAIRSDVQRELRYDPELGRKAGQMLASEETELYNELFARGYKGLWVPAARVRHYIRPEMQTLGHLYRYYHGMGMTGEILRLRENPELNEPQIFGGPRWLWRHAVTSELTFWLRRLFCPIEKWIVDFQRRCWAWGRLAAYRGRGRELNRQ